LTELLVSAGIACIIGAIVGGGLKAFGIELPVLQTLWRQHALAGFGGILLGIGILTPVGSSPRPGPTPTTAPTPTAMPTPTFTPAPTPTQEPIPTVDDFVGSWFNWTENHELGDVSVLNIARVDDKNASFEVGVFTPPGSELLPQAHNARLLEGKLVSETFFLDSVRRLKITVTFVSDIKILLDVEKRIVGQLGESTSNRSYPLERE
jgi:hypothetical protein